MHMLGCTCGSNTEMCQGGKVVAEKCECQGALCTATARCAKIPIPPIDCTWTSWGEWSDCTASCGKGKQSRIREIAFLEMNGGKPCDQSANVKAPVIEEGGPWA